MSNILFAFLALSSFAALAQTLAPAEDRPGRYVLVPMSVERPPGEGWVLTRRSETDLIFVHSGDLNFRSLVAVAGARVPNKRLHSAEELNDHLRKELKNKADSKRFKVLLEDLWPIVISRMKCVRYRQQARDLAAVGPDGNPLIVDLHGQACLHPEDGGVILTITISERAEAGAVGREKLGEIAERFFAGVLPHAPLRGNDWRQFAEKGDIDAQVWLGRALFLANKAEEALDWFGKAAEKGHLDAQTMLGLSHLLGASGSRNPEKALTWLRLAAERGYPKAEGLLGLTLITNEAVRNTDEGLRWVRKAAADGDPVGQSLLGEFLFFGKFGLETNETEGAIWYRKAAEHGEANAQYALARILAQNMGGTKVPVQSHFWLGLAAGQGHREAKKVLEQIKRPAEQPGGQPR